MQTFNQWMAHIYRELGYPESIIKQYEQNIRCEATIPDYQRWAEQDRRNADVGAIKNTSVPEGNQ